MCNNTFVRDDKNSENHLLIGTPSNIKNQGRQPSLGNISASKRESEEEKSRFVGAKNFFSSLSGMTESGSGNDTEYYEQDYNEETNRVTRYQSNLLKLRFKIKL